MRKAALVIAGLLVTVGLVVGAGLWHLHSWADHPINATKSLNVELKRGQSLGQFAAELAKHKFLMSTTRLTLLGRILETDRRMQAGEYQLSASITPRQILAKLSNGEVVTYTFRIAEGETVRQLLESLASQPQLIKSLQATDAMALADELQLAFPFAEGAFFPDTYQYRKGDSDRDILIRAHNIMQSALADAWQTRSVASVLKRPYDLLILASIVEKETGQASDRGQISQVFHKRLSDNMKLQTDPTVIYALGDEFDGNLTRAHLSIASPYNTYRYKGLPPSPIATASLASLQAAAQPDAGDYVYFVARGDGSSQFSRTLAEHNAAVRKYQLAGRK